MVTFEPVSTDETRVTVQLDWEPEGVDGPTDDDCEAHLPIGVESLPDAGGPGRVRVGVLRGCGRHERPR